MCINVYNLTGAISAFYLLARMGPEVLGITDPLVSSYARKDSVEKLIFGATELLFLFEVLYQMLGW